MSLSFHPELYDAQFQPPPHHRLAIRLHSGGRWCIRGHGEVHIAHFHPSAKAAHAAIIGYCRRLHQAATIKIYTPQAELYRTDELARDGTLTRTRVGQ